ncbi:AmmeMemoRadiSam system protein A [Candidatus Colwellia aromaticivorans]|uniref:AmmeMemoRadiSam system protein A n=1 Tax=Candidatus Colwellia aromaticivorans TaxID=2267621 RepID=UPI0014444C1B|nr:AmmeMemoRadiSam system protein A [Candidatus Colwellia aromaticivorans]
MPASSSTNHNSGCSSRSGSGSSDNASINLSEAEQVQLKAFVWQVLQNSVAQGKFTLPPPPSSKALQQIAATFVTLYLHNELRGCTGAYIANYPLWEDVCRHAYSSAFEDSRFAPLSGDELKHIHFDVSILSPLIQIKNSSEQALIDQLHVGVDGLLLKQYPRTALFLPTVWHSLPDPKSFVRELKQKGGWPVGYWASSIELFRFTSTLIK